MMKVKKRLRIAVFVGIFSAAAILFLLLFPWLQKLFLKITHTPDSEGFYQIQDYVIEDLGETNQKSLDYFVRKHTEISMQNLTANNRIYYSIIPDKAYYTQDSGYPVFDYENLFSTLDKGMPNHFTYIDVTDTLSLESFYRTDSHWRQEMLYPAAEKISQSMGFSIPSLSSYEKREFTPYFGGYSVRRESKESESLYYLENQFTQEAIVYNAETGLDGKVYDLEKLSTKTPYNVFLSGPTSFLTITNPSSETEEELVVFRDSYGSSIVPLLLGHYRKITLVDLRYLPAAYLKDYITFTDQDILFLYSTFLVNKSMILR